VTESNKSDDDSRFRENLFQIMDRIIYELNKTKKLFIVLIIATVVAIPLSFHVTSALLEPPFHFGTARIIPILVAIAFILVGIRQWLALSRWTKKYGQYKESQKKIDAKLDYDKDER
jgi:steroid 5-alpha reductase family enzyme